jgi:hypothetical protein
MAVKSRCQIILAHPGDLPDVFAAAYSVRESW